MSNSEIIVPEHERPEQADVLQKIDPFVKESLPRFTQDISKIWTPSEFLPDSENIEAFMKEVKLIQEAAKDLPYDVLAVLIGDTITEEALPSYESWLLGLKNLPDQDGGWKQWIRKWTGEENSHGDLLHTYLYLCGRVNMEKFQRSTQYLIADGFDIQTGNDPYQAFFYAIFQELATQLSHRNVAKIAGQHGNTHLEKICTKIASDESRHAAAYIHFYNEILHNHDPIGGILAVQAMMKKKVVMPAHNMREVGVSVGHTFEHFSNAAQRTGVYTGGDYLDITESTIKRLGIENVDDANLNEEAQKAKEWILQYPNRLGKVLSRKAQPIGGDEYKFSWIKDSAEKNQKSQD